jgi:protein-disulfide isomerase
MKQSSWNVLKYVVGALALFGLFLYWGEIQNRPTQPSPVSKEVSVLDQTLGPESAKILLVEYSDFQCPACSAYEPVLKQLLAKYPNDIQFVYRHFPLNQIHPNAYEAALAAEAAALQGKFWEMHDLLFETQASWSRLGAPFEHFKNLASQLNLNTEQFEADYSSSAVKDKVGADQASGLAAGIDSTPTFFLNGQPLAVPRSLEAFSTIIDAELAK